VAERVYRTYLWVTETGRKRFAPISLAIVAFVAAFVLSVLSWIWAYEDEEYRGCGWLPATERRVGPCGPRVFLFPTFSLLKSLET
jgi:hypothetical protein